MSSKLVVLKNVKKSFGKINAVDGIKLELRSGELLGLTGPDGAGKTTLLRLLAGAMIPDTGKVLVNGFDMVQDPDRAREGLGYLSQNFSLYEDLTVMENIRFFAEVRGISSDHWRPRALEILEFVGLVDYRERLAGNLSGGMKQKLGLATALVHQPQLLLLDEPTGGVDPVTRQDFWQLILRIVSEEEVGVIVSTPHMDEVARCHQVAMMKDGKILLTGSARDLRDSLSNRIIEVHGAGRGLNLEAVQDIPDVEALQTFGNSIHIRVRDASPKILNKIKKSFPGCQTRIITPTLEDVFIAFMEGGS
jgi:ABC-2 type transport system ATP-binding protein